jgi:hypothetical protein
VIERDEVQGATGAVSEIACLSARSSQHYAIASTIFEKTARADSYYMFHHRISRLA